MLFKTDTIAAISTASGNSGIGIVRISGPDAIEIANKIFRPIKKKDISHESTHTVHYGKIWDGEVILDEVLLILMRAPYTYTREDTVEIDCHGGVYVTNKILDLVISSGARPAEAGEFTKRAFLNGRIDLCQAEAVIDLINSENDYALKSAVSQLSGTVSDIIKKLRAVLLEQIAYIEAALDDPEHIEMYGYGAALRPVIDEIMASVIMLIETADDGRIMKEGIKTVILGKPNAGKSSLLNILLGQERAIVTEIEGTTRDAIEEHMRLGDITLNIIDTAGIRNTADIIEKIGVQKAMHYASEADLILLVLDSSRLIDDNDLMIINVIKDKKGICILNKKDLDTKLTESDIAAYLSYPRVCISAKTGEGLKDLENLIKQMFYKRDINFNDQVFITNARHKALLVNARESLKNVINSIEDGMPEDFYTIDMVAAYEALGQITGDVIEDDIADEIFSKFCMGK